MKSKNKKIFLIIFIVPFLLGMILLIKELNYINNSDLLIESNYQNGIVISETSRYAISEKFCKQIIIPIKLFKYKSNNKNTKAYHYSIEYNSDMSDGYNISSYTDPELNKIDEKIVKNIILDAKKNHNNLNKNFGIPDYKKDISIINEAYLTYFENSDYYHISIGCNDGNSNSATYIVNEMIYKGEKYIGELLIHGDIKYVINMEKRKNNQKQ